MHLHLTLPPFLRPIALYGCCYGRRRTLEPSSERTPQGYGTKIGLVMVAAICSRSWEGDFCLLNQTGIFARAGNNSAVSGRVMK